MFEDYGENGYSLGQKVLLYLMNRCTKLSWARQLLDTQDLVRSERRELCTNAPHGSSMTDDDDDGDDNGDDEVNDNCNSKYSDGNYNNNCDSNNDNSDNSSYDNHNDDHDSYSKVDCCGRFIPESQQLL